MLSTSWCFGLSMLTTRSLPGPSLHHAPDHLCWCAAWRLQQDGSSRSFCIQLQSDAESGRDADPFMDSSNSTAVPTGSETQRWYFWAQTTEDQQRIDKMVSLLRSPPSLTQLTSRGLITWPAVSECTLLAQQSWILSN